jgi:hypothetical protein
MALGRGPYSDTTMTIKRTSVELLCQRIKTIAMNSPEVTVKGFKKVLNI